MSWSRVKPLERCSGLSQIQPLSLLHSIKQSRNPLNVFSRFPNVLKLKHWGPTAAVLSRLRCSSLGCLRGSLRGQSARLMEGRMAWVQLIRPVHLHTSFKCRESTPLRSWSCSLSCRISPWPKALGPREKLRSRANSKALWGT